MTDLIQVLLALFASVAVFVAVLYGSRAIYRWWY